MQHLSKIAFLSTLMVAACPAPAQQGRPASGSSSVAGSDWRLSGGGRVRQQFEHFRNREFGSIEPTRDSYLLHRVQLRGEAEYRDWFAAKVELVHALAIEQETPLAPIDEDELDLLQGYAEVRFGSTRRDYLRLGRQELPLDRGRLISVREGPNVRLAFDGGRLHFERDGFELDGFVVAPVEPRQGVFDDRTSDRDLLFGLRAARSVGVGDLAGYLFGRTREDARLANSRGHEFRATAGVRWWGDDESWRWDLEAIGQFGEVASDDIAAFGLSAIASRRITSAPLPTWLGVRVDWISGDARPGDGRSQSFDALYPNNSYFSEAAAIAPGNLRSVIPTLRVEPTEGLGVAFLWNFAWRDSVRDAVYLPPGIPLAIPGDARKVGQSVTVAADWTLSDAWSLSAAFTDFQVGEALRAAGGRDLEYVAVWLNWRF